MKKKSFVVSLLSILLLATGCRGTDSSVSDVSSATDSSPMDTSVVAPYNVVSISSIYGLADGTEVVVEGVVLQIGYSTSNEPESVVLADNTGTVVIHGTDMAKTLKAGYSCVIKGKTTHWIASKEGNAAAEAGYTGAFQIEKPTLLSTDTTNHEIPSGAVIENKSFKEVIETDCKDENISSKTYKVDCKITYSKGTNFYNVYLHGADGDSYTYYYTKCKGSDLAWLKQYDGQYRTIIMTVLNAKSSKGKAFWRVMIDKVLDEAQLPSNDVMLGYALDHAKSQFLPTYTTSLEIDAALTDSKIEGVTFAYKSSSDSIIFADGKAKINLTKQETVTVTITATYNGASKSDMVSVFLNFFDPSSVTVTECSVARNMTSGETVTLKGQLLELAYDKNLIGFYFKDSTDSMLIQLKDTELSKLDDAKIGETIYVTGILDSYLSKLGGNDRLISATVDYQDFKEASIDETGMETSTVKDVMAMTPTVGKNKIAKIYKVEGVIEVVSGFYTNLIVRDITDYSKSVTIYSQNGSGTSIGYELKKWEAYNGKAVSMYLAIRNTNGDASFKYRYGIAGVKEEVAYPESFKGQALASSIKHGFTSTYTSDSVVSFDKVEGISVSMTTTSSQVTDVSNATQYSYDIDVKKAEKVSLDFSVNQDGFDAITFKVSFDIAPVNKISMTDARAEAIANSKKVIEVEGIVVSVYKSSADKPSGTFFFTDGVTSMYCYTFGDVKPGDKVSVKGSAQTYFNCPQIGTGATVTVLSENNPIPNTAETKTVAELQADKTANRGSLAYTTTGVYTDDGTTATLTDGEAKITFQEIKNAHEYHFSNWTSFKNKRVTVNIFSYTTDKATGEYTYYISSMVEAA